jgi:hypothetical protein
MPVLDPSTDTAKADASRPQSFGPPLAGHRITLNGGRQIYVITDDEARDHTQAPVVTEMVGQG